MLFMLAAALADEAPIQIAVTDPRVTQVHLVCPDRTLEAKVVGGMARFDAVVSNCSIELRSKMGRLDQPGVYTCTKDGCKAEGVVHKNISDAEGRVNIVLTDGSANMFELKCATSGHRARAMVETNTAVFDGVPPGPCTLYFKGGPPVKVDLTAPGSYTCDAVGSQGKCRPR